VVQKRRESPLDDQNDYPSPTDVVDEELEGMLYARHVEITDWDDLKDQRGTPIPALFNQFYKFIQNPSTVSVETFKRMVDTDDTIGSGVDFLTTCLAARIGMYQHPSQEITDFVNRALGKIQGGFGKAVKELLSASWAGFAVQEKVWSNTDDGWIVKKLVSLPPGTLLFETHRTGELTDDGILQYQRNYNPANLAFGSGSLFGFSNGSVFGARMNDPYAKFGDFPFPIRTANTYSYLSIRIPIEKCIHYSFDASGNFGNPYGRSLLRRAYKWYVMKDAFLQMLSVALDRKGTPLTIVFADQNTTLLDQSRDRSVMNQNLRGNANVGKRADQAAADAFRNIHNDSTIILPGKKGQIFDTDFVPQASNANDFLESIKLCDRAIMRSLLLPSLIFTGGDGTGSYALGQEHAKTFDKICDGTLDGTKDVILNQLVKHLLAYNFPRSAWEKDGVGEFQKVELTIEEIGKEIDVLDKAINCGAIDMNDLKDLNAVRSKIGFDARGELIEQPEEDGGEFGDGDGDGGKNDAPVKDQGGKEEE
jgi:hypothetical protein